MKLRNKLPVIMLLATISLSTFVKADEIVIPVITKPAVLQEGTQRELTADQIAALLPWAKDSKVFLIDLLDSLQGLSSLDKMERLVDGIKNVVGESAPKNSELLMRYALNRGLVVVDILNKESSAENVGSIDAKNRVLISSIKMALKYYDIDMKTLSSKSPAPFVTFGAEYFTFLNELNKSIFDASAQYEIQKASLEWLQWDLYRDLNNTSYAAQIVKINNAVKILPKTKLTDAQSLSHIRQMKRVNLSLDLREVRKATQEYSSTESSNGYEKSFSNQSSLNVGDRVVTHDYYTGVVTQIFKDGVIKVKINGSYYDYNSSQLSHPIKSKDGFNVGDTVVTHDYYTGVVTQVFRDGLFKVKINGSYYDYNSSQLSYTIRSKDGLDVGDTVVTHDYYTGVVTQIFRDGLFKVKINGSYYDYNSSQISHPIKSKDGFNVGDTVITKSHYTGVVTQVFRDGTIKLKINGSYYDYTAKDLFSND